MCPCQTLYVKSRLDHCAGRPDSQLNSIELTVEVYLLGPDSGARWLISRDDVQQGMKRVCMRERVDRLGEEKCTGMEIRIDW
jgi:hypothetical protein